MLYAQLHLTLPAWVHSEIDADAIYADAESQMRLAIELSRLNVAHQSGGPFGAAVFGDGGRLIGVGVNRVVPTVCSSAHAEILALSTSQQRLQRHRLNDGGGAVTLASSAQPCSMCFGALIWAGLDRLLIGARSADVETLAGFDEGPLPVDWQAELETRGIEVHRDLLRDDACAVLRAYGETGLVY